MYKQFYTYFVQLSNQINNHNKFYLNWKIYILKVMLHLPSVTELSKTIKIITLINIYLVFYKSICHINIIQYYGLLNLSI